MPSVRVPLKGEPGWDELIAQRRKFWAKDGNSKLTKNFTAQEFYCNDGTPCPVVSRDALIRLCRVYLEPMRTRFGTCFINSGYRHTRYNASIGGVPNSQHEYERTYESVAADVRFPKGNPTLWGTAAQLLRSKSGGKGGIGIYIDQGFVHIDNRSYKADWKELH